MKTRSTFTNALAVIALTAGFAIIVAVWQTRRVQAIQDSEDFPSDFGFIELGAGQTARLNAVIGNPDVTPGEVRVAHRVVLAFDVYVQDEEYSPDPGGTTAAQAGVSRFRLLRRESREVVLMRGQAASFDFFTSEATKINASVNPISNPDTRDQKNRRTPEPHLAATLELREGARTIFVVPALAKLFNPQPDPPGLER